MRHLVLPGFMLLTACSVHDLEVTPLDTESTEPVTMSSPVKSHLTDGSTVVFEEGITVTNGQVTGEGRKYDLTLDTSVRVTSIPLDDIAAMESYQTPVNSRTRGRPGPHRLEGCRREATRSRERQDALGATNRIGRE